MGWRERTRTEALLKHGSAARERINPYRRYFEQRYLEGIIRNDFLLAFLRENAPEYQFSIWSSNDRRTILEYGKNDALETFFSAIIGANDADCTKPSPDGFYLLFDPRQHEKADFLFIGDSSSDRESSHNAGIDFFKIKRQSRPLQETEDERSRSSMKYFRT